MAFRKILLFSTIYGMATSLHYVNAVEVARTGGPAQDAFEHKVGCRRFFLFPRNYSDPAALESSRNILWL